ncbi:DUF6880 family protein [Chromatium okenii]|uniref:SWIM zinc finger family protein n=1 Tax=Chromatium okenii TaxID=61644 RepID=UPI0026E9A235|nr:DUF6880 family protein [Chromatium okenii]MBV5308862.1 SWIM zinc finger family protein [Chromatium okenii]
MLNNVITIDTLEDAAGKAVFWRGEAYYSNGAVQKIQVIDDNIMARVKGTEIYHVRLWEEDGELMFDCTCPHADDGNFCKHCVAVGLTWLAGITDFNKIEVETDEKLPTDSWQNIRDYLAAQAPETLIKLLLDAAQYDERIYRSLLLKADPPNMNPDTLNTLRKAIKHAIHVDDSDYNDASTLAENINEVIDSLEELLTPNGATTLIELTEYAIERLENIKYEIDDEEGEIISIDERLGELHLQACRLASIDPSALADRLFRLEITLSETANSFDPLTYADVLGETGLQRYRELAEEEWNKAKTAGYHGNRYRIKSIMEALATACGDIEELVAIHATDLSSAYAYLNIAEIWTEAQQPEKALHWAERGLKAFPEKTDSRLRDFLIDAYLKRGRNDEAIQLAWAQFSEVSSLTHYQRLHAVSSAIGVWSEQRERALNYLHDDIIHTASTFSKHKSENATPNYSRRIQIALWEDDLEAAHTAIQQGFCEQNLLIIAAERFSSTRPQDAITIYRQIVPSFIEKTKQSAYEEAIKLLKKIATLMVASNQHQALIEYLNALRIQHKAKRNFIVLLDDLISKTR